MELFAALILGSIILLLIDIVARPKTSIIAFLDLILGILAISATLQTDAIDGDDLIYYIVPTMFVILIQVVHIAVPSFLGGDKS